MSKVVEKLRNRIGEKVRVLRLEESYVAGDKQLDNVWLELEEGKPFVFGCAGDGGIYVKKAVPLERQFEDERNSYIPATEFTWAVLEDIEDNEECLILKTSAGNVEIKNIDDELVVMFTYNKPSQPTSYAGG